MLYSKPVTEIIGKRFSCRTYIDKPIAEEDRERLSAFLSVIGRGPFGAAVRFKLIVATYEDRKALKGLGHIRLYQGRHGIYRGRRGTFFKESGRLWLHAGERHSVCDGHETGHLLAGRQFYQKQLCKKDFRHSGRTCACRSLRRIYSEEGAIGRHDPSACGRTQP